MKTISMACIIIALFTTSSCWAPKSTITATNVTQPVLVGNVTAIGPESKVDTPTGSSVKTFSYPVKNSDLVWSAIYSYGSETKREGSNTFDNQLITLSSGLNDKERNMIIIDELSFKVVGGYWLFVFYSSTEGRMDGEVYQIK
jgi:hypothetical protein